jgi:hypothetical protein
VKTAVVLGLRGKGIDVLTTKEAGMLGGSDEAHLELATRLGRVLFTEDSDFIALHNRGLQHAGIAYAHHKSIGQIVRGLTLIYEVYEDYEMLARLEYL